MRGVFVTGTDTGVGKTVVCAALMHRFRGARYWKPIQTGIETDDDTREVVRLGGCAPADILDIGVRLPRALSPHLSARLIGRTIGLGELTAIAAGQSEGAWVVEGAGGVLVPINDRDVMADLIVALELSAIVVARTTLGTINHTLLTIEALRARSVEVAGVVMVGTPDAENRSAIEAHGRVQVVGELPPLDPLTTASLGTWATIHLDVEHRLPL